MSGIRAPSTVRRAIPPKPNNTSTVLETIRQRSDSISQTKSSNTGHMYDDDCKEQIDDHSMKNIQGMRSHTGSLARSHSNTDLSHGRNSDRPYQFHMYQSNTPNSNVTTRKPVVETKPLLPTMFIVPVSNEYICKLCSGVVKAPYDIPCGHLFCRTCMLKYVKDGNRVCPNEACRTLLPPIPRRGEVSQWKLNNAIRKIVAGMTVRCRAHADGCTVQHTVGIDESNIIQHETVCPYSKVSCEQCKQQVQRQQIVEHNTKECTERTQRCTQCLESVKHKDWSQHINNDLQCSNMIYCPNRCKDSKEQLTVLPQSQLSIHQAICSQQPIQCSICDCKLPADAMTQHLQTNAVQHLNVLHNKFMTHTGQTQYDTLLAEIKSLRVENEELRSFVNEYKQTGNKQLKQLREYYSEQCELQYQELLQQKATCTQLQQQQQYVVEFKCTDFGKLQPGKRFTSPVYEYQLNDHVYTMTLFIQRDNNAEPQKRYTFCLNVTSGALPLQLNVSFQFKHGSEYKSTHVPGVSNKVLEHTFTKLNSGYGIPLTLEQLINNNVYNTDNDVVTFSAVVSTSPQIATWRRNKAENHKLLSDVNIQTD